MTDPTISQAVRDAYGRVAQAGISSRDEGARRIAEAFGYSAQELESIPADANMGLSCGNPTAIASLRAGETVLDLGSGGGLDVFLAAKAVGETGRAIGVDMTQAMIDLARRNAETGGYRNVDFRLGSIEELPLKDASVDCVISNCVLNLVPDKDKAFAEIFRVLKPGGRLAVSDIALKKPLPESVAGQVSAWVGCIAGAVSIEANEQGLARAGFQDVQVIDAGADLNAYKEMEGQNGCCAPVPEETATACCGPAPAAEATVTEETGPIHKDLAALIDQIDLNSFAASVKIFALKP